MSGFLGFPPVSDWLQVGDLGFFWEGELYITGRSKDLIVVGGRNIHPNDVEAAVGCVSGVRPGCVVALGVESEGSQKIVLLAEVRKRDSQVGKAIQAAINRVVALPAEVVLLEPRTLPKTPSGKIRRQESKRRYLAKELRPAKLRLSSLKKPMAAWLTVAPVKFKHLTRGLWSWTWILKCWFDMVVLQREPKLSVERLLRRLGVRLSVKGEPFGAGPVMVVANHASLLDGIILMALWRGEPLRFVIAETTAQHPLMRSISRAHLSVSRGLGKAGLALEKLKNSLENGSCLAVFPEGGIEFSSGIRGFAIGAFQACAQTKARLQPVAISGSRQVLTQGEWVVYPGDVEVTFLEILEPQNGSFQEAVSLSKQARELIAGELSEHCFETRLSRRD